MPELSKSSSKNFAKQWFAVVLLFVCGVFTLDCSNNTSTTSDASTSDQQVQDQGPVSDNPLENKPTPKLIKDGFAFTEGPIWDKNKQILYFSDILFSKIHTLTLPDKIGVFREKSELSNGLAFTPKGELLAAEQGSRRLTKVLKDGKVEVITDKYDGKKYHSPNDIAVRADGTIFFTDPPYIRSEEQREIPFNGVFAVSSSGKVTALWKGESKTRPNGIALSPDEQRLYFADAAAKTIWVATVKKDGTTEQFKEFVKTAGETPDGMTIDARENLYFATREGIEVFGKDGKSWGVIKVPQQPTNCTFGGKNNRTLFITARTHLYAVENMPFAGAK